jgi:hypothetical protein
MGWDGMEGSNKNEDQPLDVGCWLGWACLFGPLALLGVVGRCLVNKWQKRKVSHR